MTSRRDVAEAAVTGTNEAGRDSLCPSILMKARLGYHRATEPSRQKDSSFIFGAWQSRRRTK